MKHQPTYNTWHTLKKRCDLPSDPGYKNYGGRGITYPANWKDYSGFLQDMGERPDGTTLDRRDNEKSYSKENCRWATPLEQAQNRRNRCDNTSGAQGVSYHAQKKKWRTRCTYNGKLETLYYGPSKEKAIAARLAWEAKNGKRT